MNYFDRICSEDDEIVNESMRKEYGGLHRYTCFYQRMDTPFWRVFSMLQLLMWTCHFAYFVITLVVTGIKLHEDLSEMVQSFHYAIVVNVMVYFVIPHVVHRRTVAKAHRAFILGLSNYDEETEAYRKPMKSDVIMMKRYLLRVLIAAMAVALTLITAASFIDKLLDTSESNDKDVKEARHVDGVSFDLPIPQWTPLGTDTTITYLIALFSQSLIFPSYYLGLLLPILMYLLFSLNLALEINLLILSLERLSERTKLLYRFHYGDDTNVNFERIKQDKKLANCYKECLKQNVIHHQKIIELFNDYNELFAPCLFLLYTGGAIMLGLCAVLVVFAEGKFGTIIMALNGVIVEAGIGFFYAWCSEQIYQASEKLPLALYSTDWMITDRDISRTIHIMLIRSQQPLVFKYRTLMEMSYVTFSTLMNSAYSYFNVLFAFSQ